MLVAVLAAAFFIAYPRFDLWVGHRMLGPDGRFLLGRSRLFDILHYLTNYWVGLTIAFFAVAAALHLLGRPVAKLGPSHALYVALVFVIGPGLLANALLKDHSHRPRPGDVLQFQGDDLYAAPFAFDGACDHNCSFVAGDPSAAFALAGPALLLPPGRRKWGIAGVLAFGALVGLMRMYQGGHFLSDVIFAALLSLGTALVLHWAMFRADGAPRRLGLVKPPAAE
ncbi:MAG TPA: phosphatase PAP2 family protein [Dongiaceae bacterium]|nr:phosphatase PAP2 family protein [Dongiaceae bacterium]